LGVLASIISVTIAIYITPKVPKGWLLTGNAKDKYEIGTALDNERNKDVQYLYSLEKDINKEFGTMAKRKDAVSYRDKKVELTADIRTKDVKNWVGMWMRIDHKKHKILAFDNMSDRPLKGSNPWTKCRIVLNVPKESSYIVYGVLLAGTGKVWVDNVKIKSVSKSTKTTNTLF